jgi:tRNA(fMet)-specific endonuclease VapC
MSLYVLDTDILTLYQFGHAAVVQHVQQQSTAQLAVSIISVEEQLTGWYTKLRRTTQHDQLARVYQHMTDAVRFLSRLQILPFPEPALQRYEQLRATFRRMNKNDLRIAAITLEHGGILVTRNVQDFQQIPGLQFEDWSQ